MNYLEISGYLVMALGGFTLGTLYGRRLATEASSLVQSLEGRLGRVEQALAGAPGDAQAAATNHHAAAIEQLAGAIAKHAAAVDDHGAATVAAAVEHSAAGAALAAAGK
ncbi:MAG: hypothetical protein ACREQD_00365 [Candidatus Binataceae bacterium]